MKSLWNDKEAQSFGKDPLQLRVYTSRLLGLEPRLVLHGGGNTSVKMDMLNAFGEQDKILFIKGSGIDLKTIEKDQFAAVRLNVLQRMAELDQLSDTELVKLQRSAMIDHTAPNPSLEAILHAIIPFQYVDHTHADDVVLITNTKNAKERIREIYQDRVLIVPYRRAGFELARTIYKLTRKIDWQNLTGIILLNHGVITFGNSARTSYENMLQLVTAAETYLKKKQVTKSLNKAGPREDLLSHDRATGSKR
jgi:rhamnose utilization protein RhaD (predicted bifunctional aldolase and dehydrogenase)